MDNFEMIQACMWLISQKIPIAAIAPNSKRPTRGWSELQNGEIEKHMELIQEFLADLYRGDADRFAIINGPQGIVALDIDARGATIPEDAVRDILARLQLPEDYPWHWRSQSGRGWHIWLRIPDLPAKISHKEIPGGAKHPWRAIEIRARKVCTIIPPNIPEFPKSLPQEIPYALLQKLIADLGPKRRTPIISKEDANRLLQREILRVQQAVEGNRNNSLNVAAYNLGQLVGKGIFDRARIEQALLAATSLPYKEAARTIRSGIEAGIRDADASPRGRRIRDEAFTADVARMVHAAGYRFFYNEEAAEILIEDRGRLRRIEDSDVILLRGWMKDRQLPLYMAEIAIYYLAMQHPIRPIRDGLESLQWDGGDYIAQLAAHLIPEEDIPAWLPERWLSLWMLGAVGKVFERWQNPVLVLEGPQGIGKSFFARWLGSVIPNAFLEEAVDPHAKDSLLLLSRFLIWEIPELDAATSRHDAAALKHFITRETITIRPPYGRTHVERPALTSMIATVNDRAGGYLPDETGNRRFLILPLREIDHSYPQKLSPAQVWGEAVARWRAGERPYLDSEDIEARDAIAEMRQTMGIYDEWIRKNVCISGDPRDTLSLIQIINRMRDSDFAVPLGDRGVATSIGLAMARLKVPRARTITESGNRIRVWVGVRFI